MLNATHSEIVNIPLNLLKPSPHNQRKKKHTQAYIALLADDLKVNGQLQNLVVEPELTSGEASGCYWVTVGEGRRQAQWLRAERGEIPFDEPIPCKIDTLHAASSMSLSENVVREAMHPADEYEAFRALIESGRSIEDVAAQYHVAPSLVQRRLRLANVAPQFISAYRDEKISLDQLMALAGTEDHVRQHAVWEALHPQNRSARAIRAALSEHEIAATDPIARFVGQAYKKAGGAFRHDLFADDNAVFLVDVDLLKGLALQKLEKIARKLTKQEKPAWIEARLSFDYAERAAYGTVTMTRRPPTSEEQATREALRSAAEQAEAACETANESDDEEGTNAAQAALDGIQERIDAVDDGLCVADPEQLKVAGTVVSIDTHGKLQIERHLLKAEDRECFKKAAKAAARATQAPGKHSAALLRALSAQRTVALQATLATQPKLMLVTLVHRLLEDTFGRHPPADPLKIEFERPLLDKHDAAVKSCKAQQSLNELRQACKERLPDDATTWFSWLLAQSQDTVLEFLAVCMVGSLDGVSSDESASSLSELASAAGLDVRQWWSPTAAGYFARVKRQQVLDAIAELDSPQQAALLARLKRNELNAAAEVRAARSGWLPACMRTNPR